MKKLSCIIALLLIVCISRAQKETFDLATYSPLKGWKKEKKAQLIQFTKKDQAKGTYCVITVYKGIDASDDAKANFDASWESLVKETLGVNDAPEMQEPSKEDGWEAQSGYAAFESDGDKGVALLVASTGYNKVVNILILTNTNVYEREMTNFLSSIDLKKTVTPGNKTNDNADTTPQPPPVKGKFAFTTTNFDNGWTSNIYDDYILTTKGDIKVYLSYIEKFNASDFAGNGKEVRHHYWDNYVSKYFTTGEKKFDTRGFLSDFSQDYIEGWATDKQTNEKRYIGMIVRVVAFTGTLSIIIVSAPDDQQLRQQFPKADAKFDNDLLPMYGYNKFAVSKTDLPGKWVTGGKGASMNWYSATTGNNVGATAAATSDVFTFGTGSSYTSKHSGASGWVGAMNTYKQEYKGIYTVTNWSATMTNRWQGKTEKFDAWFEIVRGGRVLHLVEGPSDMSLFKEE